MLIRWLIATAISIGMLSFNSTMRSGSLQQGQMRDLSRYDKAGPYTIKLNLNGQGRSQLEAAIRGFLWDHWNQRRLGHVRVTQYSKEGEPSTSSYFVEPDEKGIWHIAIKTVRTVIDRDGRKRQRHESVEYVAYSVERTEVPKYGLTQSVAIPEQETRTPQSYRLAFKDQKGELLTQI